VAARAFESDDLEVPQQLLDALHGGLLGTEELSIRGGRGSRHLCAVRDLGILELLLEDGDALL
jgi:hypothetical protein